MDTATRFRPVISAPPPTIASADTEGEDADDAEAGEDWDDGDEASTIAQQHQKSTKITVKSHRVIMLSSLLIFVVVAMVVA